MTREHKLALIVGFALILVVGVFVSDHFSKARLAKPGDQLATSAGMPRAQQNQPVAYPKAEPVLQLASNPPAPAPVAPQHEPGTWTTGDKPTLGGGLAGDVSAGATRGPSLAGDPRVTPTRGGADLPAAAGPLVDVPSEGGVRLPIPAPQTRDTRTAATVPTPTPNPALPVSSGELKKHTVAKGDSLAKISRKYYGDDKLWNRLAEYNKSRVSADNNVNLGVTLMIPPRDVLMGQASLAPEGARPPAARTELAKADATKAGSKPDPRKLDPKKADPKKPETAPAPKAAERTYTVKSGDTLALIAERELGSGKRWREIQRLNTGTLGDDDTIAVGMVLKLPAKS